MKPKVIFGTIAGVTMLLVGIGGVWLILNFETVAAKALQAVAKFAAKRGVELDPDTIKLLLELSGGAAGATAGAAGQTAAKTGKAAARTGKAPARTGKQAAGKTRQTGSGAGRRVAKAARSAG